jgi:hypothetical protein
MTSINIDIGSVEVFFDDLAGDVVDNQAETDLLFAMAAHCEHAAAGCEDAQERDFFSGAAARYRELAKWLEENSP